MLQVKLSCIQCGKDYTHERGKNAIPINTSHKCDDCLNPPAVKAWVEPEIKVKKYKKEV